MTVTPLEHPVVWDLCDLYAGLDDPAIEADIVRARERARAFEAEYRGRIAAEDCTADLLRAALDEYDQIGRQRTPPAAYASLMFSADTSDPRRGALLQRMQVEGTSIARHLIFFDLEIGKMPDSTFSRIVGDPALASYRHYLEHERAAAKHHLTESEETVVEELNNTGSRAFLRLFSEITSRARYRMKVGHEVRDLTQSEALAYLYQPDRALRRAAAEAITDTVKDHAHVLTFIYNNLLQEKSTMDRLRGYEYPEQARHESNELSPVVVDNVVQVCSENFDIVADFYRVKRRLLGVDSLADYDRYAPISESDEKIPFSDGQRIILSAFEDFTPAMREMVEPFFGRRWIDAEVRPGKRGGAFCSYITPDYHPYVFMNYTERTRDVMTLAHELGHAVHGVLAGRQNFLNFYPSLPMAETASVFGEMLVFERLMTGLEDPRERLALLAGKIEDTFATVFRQVSMFRFEQAAHRARRAEGELTTERFNELWQGCMQEMFGDSLVMGEGHAWWWLYIPHIFSTPFYVYAYSFGELLVLALYARYRQEGQPFIAKYMDLLAAGGSQRPDVLLANLGIDVSKKEFWQGGIDLIREMVGQVKELAACAD